MAAKDIFFEVNDTWTTADLVSKTVPPLWTDFFRSAFSELSGAAKIVDRIEQESRVATTPHRRDIFKVFYMMDPHNIKVVIFGQDPYYTIDKISGQYQANGISFSVNEGQEVPISLKHIYEELVKEYREAGMEYVVPPHGVLDYWISQGVFLINRALTTKLGEAKAHGKIWLCFVKRLIDYIISLNPNVIFCIWGKDADVEKMISGRAELFLAPHPVGRLSTFIGCDHFKLINASLGKHGIPMIDWTLPWKP